jgi:Mg-chelatase subunit ChlD
MKARLSAIAATILAAFVSLSAQQPQQQRPDDNQKFRFKTGIDLINVNATVTDASGRFVPGLRKEDFSIFEDGKPQQVTHFSSERVPVSLGIVLDTSQSMEGEKIVAAREALNRFLFDLLDRDDEVFVYRFDSIPDLVTGWTTDRERIREALGRIRPRGGTALYDTLREAIPLAQTGRYQKKAIVIISDGNDTSSRSDVEEIKRLIRETEVLVYAVGIDAQELPASGRRLPASAAATLSNPAALPDAGRTPAAVASAHLSADVAQSAKRRLGQPGGRARQRRRAARYHRRQRRTDRDHPIRARPRPGDGRHRRRVEQAVLPWLSGRERKGRQVAQHPRRGPEPELPREGENGLRRSTVAISYQLSAISCQLAESR